MGTHEGGIEMKYIRTKDGRIAEIDIESMLPDDKPYQGEGIGQYCGVPIVAQSDHLEDLCDEVIAEKDDHDFLIWDTMRIAHNSIVFFKKMYVGLGYKIYAANFTDKGIIYVAKWNGNGWELI